VNKMEAKEWQQDALNSWIKNKLNGTIKAPTGTGKSFLAKMAYKFMSNPKTVVIVPSINLKEQWEKDFPEADVVVINTARKDPENFKNYSLIVLDEIHHYASPESQIIFDHFYGSAVLGLSATPERQDGEHAIFDKHCPIVYQYNFGSAIENKDMAPFEMHNVEVDITGDERQRITNLTSGIRNEFKVFNFDIMRVHSAIKHGDWQEKKIAGQLLRRIGDRKEILLDNAFKNNKAVELILNNPNEKIIVFTELISSANKIEELVTGTDYPNKVFIYHSEGKKKEKQKQLDEFKTCLAGVLISAKALDEGVNVPSCGVAIIVGGSSVKRQFVQRLGRVLRPIEGKVAKLYQLYIPQTKDEEWMNKRSDAIAPYSLNLF